jgi:hypothetical protein
MPDAMLTWFQQQVKQLPAVRACHPGYQTAADLVIRTWMGMNVNVYFLDGVPNLRALRRELQENTHAYSGSMFIGLHTLMPPDKTRLVPDEWMQALHQLNSGRIYTYIPGQPRLLQVHFDYLPDGREREAWYGGDVQFDKLRVTRVSGRVRVLRGSWMMADFGQNPYWTNRNFRAKRLNERYWQQRQSVGGYVRGQYDAGGHPGGASDEALNRAHTSHLQHCYIVLGVEMNADRAEVKAAYRRLARVFHPDTSDLPAEDAQIRFQEITAAYHYIKEKRRWS